MDLVKSRHALMLILTNPAMREALVTFSKAEHNEENVLLWVAIKNFKDAPAADRDAAANGIVDLVRVVCVGGDASTPRLRSLWVCGRWQRQSATACVLLAVITARCLSLFPPCVPIVWAWAHIPAE